jgi:iron(III) transport system substrate-binding protein
MICKWLCSRFNNFGVYILIGLSVITVLACSTASQSPASITESGTITVYSGRSERLVAPIIKEFSLSTGIIVKVKYAGTPQLAATILEEGKNSPADVFFAQDPGGLGAVEFRLLTLPESLLDRVPEWAHSPEGRWVGISGRARTIVYNTNVLEEHDLPDDIWDFVDPKWKGRVGWAPTNASFQTMVTAMLAIWGDDKTRQWLLAMQDNEVKAYPKNTPIVNATGTNEIDVGFVNHYYLYRFLAEHGDAYPVRNYHPRTGGPGAIILVSGAGILDTSSNKRDAQKFVEYLLSVLGQEYFASSTYEYPLLAGVSTDSRLVPLAEIKKPAISVNKLMDLEETQGLLRETGVLP